jgi:photosystem II stability/assembly factor-like uncharacterized protein
VGAGTLSNDPLEQTTNGGNTFTAVEAPLGHTGHWDVIGFTNPQDGHAFWAEPDAEPPDGFQSLWHTTDGGSHWTEVTIKA